MTESTALATLANIEELVEGRGRAIELWGRAFDDFHATAKLAGAASIGGALPFAVPLGGRYEDASLARAFGKGDREEYVRLVTEEVDRRCWSGLMSQLGFDALLDRQARDEFRASLQGTPPEFSVENCAATFGNIWATRRDIYLRGIANVFMAMDRRFRSHDAFAIGNRLIIENAINMDGWWHNYNRRDTLHDVERIFRELDGKPPFDNNVYASNERKRHGAPDMRSWGVVRRLSHALISRIPTPFVLETEYFRLRVFGNGNLHLWFTRKDLLGQVNALLLEYYKPVEGDVGAGPDYHSAPRPHATPAKNFGEFFSSEEVAARVVDLANIRKGDLVLEPSAGSGVIADAARAKGATVHCVEVQAHWASMLRQKGFAARADDFLTMPPVPQYDRVVMNPPFDRGRDCDHVMHAYQFLKPGGVLVAVMSARAEFATDGRHKALHDLIKQTCGRYRVANWYTLPERSFAHAGTNVNTVMLKIEKPRA